MIDETSPIKVNFYIVYISSDFLKLFYIINIFYLFLITPQISITINSLIKNYNLFFSIFINLTFL